MVEKQDLEWIDNLRAVATLGVIIVHVAVASLEQTTFLSINWWLGNLIESLVRFCVPVFLMISGALLFSKTYIIIKFLKKRVLRIFPPLIFWSIVYISSTLIFIAVSVISVKPLETLAKIINNGISFHFWYVYLILGLYLFIPIIGKWGYQANLKELNYFLIIWLITSIPHLPFISQFQTVIDLSNFSGYVGYLVLGHYLATRKFTNQNKSAYFLVGLGIFTTSMGTYFASIKINALSQVYYQYLTPNVILLSCGVFLLFKETQITNKTFQIIRTYLCRYSFGIYLVHMLVLSMIYKTPIKNLLSTPPIGIPVIAVLCVVLSILIVSLINKIPIVGKRISG